MYLLTKKKEFCQLFAYIPHKRISLLNCFSPDLWPLQQMRIRLLHCLCINNYSFFPLQIIAFLSGRFQPIFYFSKYLWKTLRSYLWKVLRSYLLRYLFSCLEWWQPIYKDKVLPKILWTHQSYSVEILVKTVYLDNLILDQFILIIRVPWSSKADKLVIELAVVQWLEWGHGPFETGLCKWRVRAGARETPFVWAAHVRSPAACVEPSPFLPPPLLPPPLLVHKARKVWDCWPRCHETLSFKKLLSCSHFVQM